MSLIFDSLDNLSSFFYARLGSLGALQKTLSCYSGHAPAIQASRPLPPSRSLFWWKEFGLKLSTLLQRASYADDVKQEILAYLITQLIPLMGPTPSEFITTGPCSFLSDDHTPAELIWVVDGDGRMSIRYSMEPLSPRSGVPSSSNVWRPTLDAFYNFPRIAGVDLSWSDICRETLTYDSDPDSETRESASQFFLGGDFGSKGVLGKVYFLPHYRAKVMNVSEESLVQDCMTALGVGSPCDRLFAFTESLPKDKRPSIAMVAVDCLEPSKNRAKVYFRTHVSTFNDIKDLLTLGGSLSGPIIIDTLAILHRLWELFFPGVAADENLVPTFPERFQPGFMIYFEMILGQQTLHPKVYIPVRQYCKSDAQIGSAISKYYEGINDDFSQRYISDLANLFPHRPLAARTGIHTYVGCCSRKTGPQLSFYLSPECFAPERT